MKNYFVKLLLAFFCAYFPLSVSAQLDTIMNVHFKKITSWEFGGRGYVDSGSAITAKYLAEYLSKNKVQKLPSLKSYFQPFTADVNTYPAKMELRLDDRYQIAGIKYIIKNGSPSTELKNCPIIHLTQFPKQPVLDSINKKVSQYALYITKEPDIDYATITQLNPKLKSVFIEKSKLTWTAGNKSFPIPIIELLKGESQPSIINQLSITHKLEKNYPLNNVVGIITPESVSPTDSFIVFTAHYDHLGKMGKDTYFPGANDNASGTVLLMDLIRHYTKNTPKMPIVFIFFAGEEAGLLGSKYFVENPAYNIKKTKLLINLDLASMGADGVMLVNGVNLPHQVKQLEAINKSKGYLKEIKTRPNTKNSDHYPFTEKGVKALFMYLMENYPHYHDVYDGYGKPNFIYYPNFKNLLIDYTESLWKP